MCISWLDKDVRLRSMETHSLFLLYKYFTNFSLSVYIFFKVRVICQEISVHANTFTNIILMRLN